MVNVTTRHATSIHGPFILRYQHSVFKDVSSPSDFREVFFSVNILLKDYLKDSLFWETSSFSFYFVYHFMYHYVPPLTERWGHVGLLCCESLPFISPQRFLSYRRSNTRRWPNARLMLAHRLRRWADISPVLRYHVVFGATLNVGQRHRRRANINPALVQSIVHAPYRQHADKGTMKYWLGHNGYWPAPVLLAQHLIDIGSVPSCNRGQQ